MIDAAVATNVRARLLVKCTHCGLTTWAEIELAPATVEDPVEPAWGQTS